MLAQFLFSDILARVIYFYSFAPKAIWQEHIVSNLLQNVPLQFFLWNQPNPIIPLLFFLSSLTASQFTGENHASGNFNLVY